MLVAPTERLELLYYDVDSPPFPCTKCYTLESSCKLLVGSMENILCHSLGSYFRVSDFTENLILYRHRQVVIGPDKDADTLGSGQGHL